MVRDAASRLLTMRVLNRCFDLILRGIAQAMRLEGWTALRKQPHLRIPAARFARVLPDRRSLEKQSAQGMPGVKAHPLVSRF
jgi:hypothetical protein